MAVVTNTLALVGIAALLASAADAAKNVIVSNIVVTSGIPQIDMQDYHVGYINFNLPVTIKNYNYFPLAIDYFKGTVSYGLLNLTDVELPFGLYIESGGQKTINLEVDVPIVGLGQNIADLIEQGNIFSAIINQLKLNGYILLLGNYQSVRFELKDVVIPLIG